MLAIQTRNLVQATIQFLVLKNENTNYWEKKSVNFKGATKFKKIQKGRASHQ